MVHELRPEFKKILESNSDPNWTYFTTELETLVIGYYNFLTSDILVSPYDNPVDYWEFDVCFTAYAASGGNLKYIEPIQKNAV